MQNSRPSSAQEKDQGEETQRRITRPKNERNDEGKAPVHDPTPVYFSFTFGLVFSISIIGIMFG